MARRITYRQIEAFKEVMRFGSITLAADALSISQPAVSRLIADLEDNLKMKLFIRHPNHLEASVESKLLVGQVNQLYVGLEKIEQSAKAIANLNHGYLRIVALPVLLDGYLPHVLAKFHQDHPQVRVELESSNRDDIYDQVQTNRFDFGLSVVTTAVKRPKVSNQKIQDHVAMCAVPVDHILASRKSISVNQIAQHPLIMLPTGSPFRAEIDVIFTRKKLKANIVFESRTQQSICQFVARGCGISIVDEAVKYFVNDQKVKLIPIKPELTWEVNMLTLKSETPSLAHQQFVRYLRSV